MDGGRLRSRRANAFEDVSSQGSEGREERLDRAFRLLDEQADLLMASEPPTEDPIEGRHAPYDPHRRPLSAAARRLIQAHLRLEGSPHD